MLEMGNIIKTDLNESVIVLDVKENDAILFAGIQFVYAHGIKLNERTNRYEWNRGEYFFSINELSEKIAEENKKNSRNYGDSLVNIVG